MANTKQKRSSIWQGRVKPEDYLRTYDMTDEPPPPEIAAQMNEDIEKMTGRPVPKAMRPTRGPR